jgi:hypothetical protein
VGPPWQTLNRSHLLRGRDEVGEGAVRYTGSLPDETVKAEVSPPKVKPVVCGSVEGKTQPSLLKTQSALWLSHLEVGMSNRKVTIAAQILSIYPDWKPQNRSIPFQMLHSSYRAPILAGNRRSVAPAGYSRVSVAMRGGTTTPHALKAGIDALLVWQRL